MTALDNIRVVLVGTTHPGNIGAAARAMKVMGLSDLRLVAPRAFPSAEATAMASSADDVLADAGVHDDLEDAVADCELILGTTARLRALSMPQLDPRAAAARTVAEAGSGRVALVFGREKNGLENREIHQCHYLVNIPTGAAYQSLNLAQAVQIVCYEVHLAALADHAPERPPLDWTPAPAGKLEHFFGRLQRTLLDIRYLNPRQPKRLMERLRRLFLRARPDSTELDILNGILTSASEAAQRDEHEKD